MDSDRAQMDHQVTERTPRLVLARAERRAGEEKKTEGILTAIKSKKWAWAGHVKGRIDRK